MVAGHIMRSSAHVPIQKGGVGVNHQPTADRRLKGPLQSRRIGWFLAVLCVLWVWATPPAEAFLVNLGYRVGYQYLRLLEYGKAVHHDLRIRLDPPTYRAYFTDELTIQATRNTHELY